MSFNIQTMTDWDIEYLEALKQSRVFAKINSEVFGPRSLRKFNREAAGEIIRNEITEVILTGEEDVAEAELRIIYDQLFTDYNERAEDAMELLTEIKGWEVREDIEGWLESLDMTEYITGYSINLLKEAR